MSAIRLKIRYEWRLMYDDGSLHEVPQFGPYYDRQRLESYATTEEAEQALLSFAMQYDSLTQFDNLVLVKRYNAIKEG